MAREKSPNLAESERRLMVISTFVQVLAIDRIERPTSN